MALTYSEISAITQKYFIPKLVDNIFASNALLARMKSKVRKADGGESIMVPLAYATTTAAGWYSGMDTLTTTSNDQFTSAEFQYRQAYANITISRMDELKNSGKEQIVNFVKSKVQMAEKTLADNLGTGLYNAGTTTNAIEGLHLVTDVTGTYGGIAKATYSWWQAKQDTSTTALTIAALRGLVGDCTVDSDGPTAITCLQDYYDDLYGLLQPQQRFTDTETANGGFKNILFEGIPVIVDSHATSAHMYLLNEKYLELVVHKDEDFRFEPFTKPINQNASSAKVYWAGNLTCSNCRMQGTFTALV
jgi:hypothetical protein